MTKEEFSKAYSTYFSRTQRFLLYLGLRTPRAEELAQAAWSKAWERRAQLRQDESVGAWVQVIALNLWRSELRSAPCYIGLDEHEESARCTIEQHMDAAKALDALSAEDRRLMLLHVVGGLTSREIACQSNLSAVSVRVRLHRAAAKLRKRFSRSDRIEGVLVDSSRQ